MMFPPPSTGIIYQYFNDKKEIFIEGVKNYSNTILYHEIDILSTQSVDFNNIDETTWEKQKLQIQE